MTPFTGLLLKPGSKSGRSVICPPLAPFRERFKPSQDANRSAVGQREDSIELPARKQFSSGSGHIPREGKVVGEVRGEVVADVNAGQSPIGPPIVRVLWHGSAYIQIPAETLQTFRDCRSFLFFRALF